MNKDQAKQLSLAEVLAELGHQPSPKQNDRTGIWYQSPFRQETKPSFKVLPRAKNPKGNIDIWFDHGEGQGGNVLDFAVRYYGTDVSGALAKLHDLMAGAAPLPPRPAPPQVTKRTAEPVFTDVQIEPLARWPLLTYLQERGIDRQLARQYLQELHWKHQGSDFYALAFANDHGGYELRNRYFQGVYGTKAITLLHPEKAGAGGAVAVFEGFFDYLSALAYYGKPEATAPVIVMNSAAMLTPTLDMIRQLNASTVHLYLDHDATGERVARQMQERLPDLEVIDHSPVYAGHKDFNAFWCAAPKARTR